MSVLLETSLGDCVLDLFIEEAPLAATNFLKLAKLRYFDGCLVFNVQQNYIMQCGDPTGTGRGGTSVWGLLDGDTPSAPVDEAAAAAAGGREAAPATPASRRRHFRDEFTKKLRHNRSGLVSMANAGAEHTNGSQFFVSLRGDALDHLDDHHTLFGEVAEGYEEVFGKANELYCDDDGRPFRDVRVIRAHVLHACFVALAIEVLRCCLVSLVGGG